MASCLSSSTMSLWYPLSAPHSKSLLALNLNLLVLPRHSFPRSVLTFARRRNKPNSAITSSSSKKKKKKSLHNDIKEDDDLDEDAFEALFNQLEEDLKNDGLSLDDDDDEISEEDLARLERELDEALGDDEVLDSAEDGKINEGAEEYDDEEEEEEEEKPLKHKNLKNNTNSSFTSSSSKKKKKKSSHNDIQDEDAFEALFDQLEEDLKNDDPSLDDGDGEEDLARLESELEEALRDDERLGVVDSNEDDQINEGAEDYDDDEEEEKPLKLKKWQQKRLAYALKNGRRKTSIKNLAADLCLDRAVVLELLRDPPPDLLMLSDVIPDKPVQTVSEPESKPSEAVSLETETETVAETETEPQKPDAKVEPIHVMQSRWSAQKRLKKVQVETLERVYGRTKRPTNAMISSIVHVTNLPRKRVVKWFEDKRGEEGLPDRRLPYQRSDIKTVFT